MRETEINGFVYFENIRIQDFCQQKQMAATGGRRHFYHPISPYLLGSRMVFRNRGSIPGVSCGAGKSCRRQIDREAADSSREADCSCSRQTNRSAGDGFVIRFFLLELQTKRAKERAALHVCIETRDCVPEYVSPKI